MQSTTRVTLTLGVVLVAATAGCSGLLGDTSGGYDVAGSELQGQQLTAATASAVQSAGSYTLDSSVTITRNGSDGVAASTANVTTRVDFDARRGLRQTRNTGDTPAPNLSVVYTDGNRSYLRQQVRGEVTYASQQGSGSIDPVSFATLAQNFTTPVDTFRWERNGTTTVEGTAVTRYTVAGVANNASLTGQSDRGPRRASGTLLVDGDGVVRELSVAYTVRVDGERRSYDGTITLTDIGSTTVEEPDWLDDARSA